jgi:hypothetical protein
MSTKTSFKRIALVAVAALGMGVLASVSASAAVTTSRALFVDSTGSTTYDDATQTVAGNIGTATTATVAITTVTAADATEVISITPAIVSAPASSTLTVGTAGTAKVGMITTGYTTGDINTSATSGDWTLAVSSGVSTLTFNAVSGPALTAAKVGALSLTADVAGTYVVSVTPSSSTGTGTTNTPVTVTFKISDLHAVSADALSNGTAENTAVNGVAGANNYVTLKAIAGAATPANDRLLKVTGSTIYGVTTAAEWSVATDKTSAILLGGSTDDTLRIATPSVGTITVELFGQSQSGVFSSTALSSVTITVNATANSGVINTTNSAAVVLANSASTGSYDSHAEISAGTNLTSAVDGRVSGVASALIAGIVRDSVPAGVTGATISMTVSGPGTISASVNGSTSQALADGGKADSIVTVSDGLYYGRLYSDGTSGVSTITIKSGTTVLSTKTVTFYGAPAKISATQNLYNVAAGSTLGKATASGAATGADVANTYAATIKVTDALNNPAVGTVSVLSSDVTVIAGGACTADGTTTGTYNCEVTGASGATAGKTATLTWQVVTADGTKASAAPLTFKVGGTAAKATVAPAATSYAPGALVTLNVTVTDALGNAAADLDTNVFAAGIKSSVSLTKDWTAAGAGEASIAVINGVAKLTFYAPLTSGPVVIDLPVESAFNLSSTITKLTTTVNVSDSASMSAITTLINSLIAKINALNKLVIKIQKKVRA